MNNKSYTFNILIGKFKFLVNSKKKRFIIFSLLFFLFLSIPEIRFFLCETPNKPPVFEELNISEGKFSMTENESTRTKNIIYLRVNNEILRFTCSISSNNETCLGNYNRIVGKDGRIWWKYSYNLVGFDKQRLVYQLEIDKKLILIYENQVSLYKKRAVFFPNGIVWFLFFFCLFIKLQFKNVL